MFELTERDLKRLWSKIDRRRKNQCWPWVAKARLPTGYGVLKLKAGNNLVASRIVCFLAHGAAPDGKPYALHSCDNPPCCNPDHLRWGAQKDNVQDAIERKRASKPPVNFPGRHAGKMPKGLEVWNNSLTEADAREIFRLHMEHRNVTQIAEAVGKPKHVVADVCRGRSWQHLPNVPSPEELKNGGVRRGFNQFS